MPPYRSSFVEAFILPSLFIKIDVNYLWQDTALPVTCVEIEELHSTLLLHKRGYRGRFQVFNLKLLKVALERKCNVSLRVLCLPPLGRQA